MIILIFFATHWYLSLFAHSFLNHRYASHAQFTMSKGVERFWYILSYILQGSSYLSPYAYGAMHRMHHAYADTDKDPHSPKFSKGPIDMMIKTKNIYSDIFRRRLIPEAKFLKNLPDWHKFDLMAESYTSRILWSLAYIAFYVVFATHWWMYFLIPIHILMAPIHGVIINWYAHKVGYRTYQQSNTSSNLKVFALFMNGEGYHNNHHKFPGRANFGVKWYEIDTMYPFIYLMDKIGMIKIVRTGNVASEF